MTDNYNIIIQLLEGIGTTKKFFFNFRRIDVYLPVSQKNLSE